jgi:hypothetical protein
MTPAEVRIGPHRSPARDLFDDDDERRYFQDWLRLYQAQRRHPEGRNWTYNLLETLALPAPSRGESRLISPVRSVRVAGSLDGRPACEGNDPNNALSIPPPAHLCGGCSYGDAAPAGGGFRRLVLHTSVQRPGLHDLLLRRDLLKHMVLQRPGVHHKLLGRDKLEQLGVQPPGLNHDILRRH